MEVTEKRYATPRPMTKRGKRLNQAQVELLVKGYPEGKTVYQLRDEFGIARQTVRLVLKRNGVAMRRQGLAESKWAEVAQLREEGWSYARLGVQFGVNASTARNFLIRGAA